MFEVKLRIVACGLDVAADASGWGANAAVDLSAANVGCCHGGSARNAKTIIIIARTNMNIQCS